MKNVLIELKKGGCNNNFGKKHLKKTLRQKEISSNNFIRRKMSLKKGGRYARK